MFGVEEREGSAVLVCGGDLCRLRILLRLRDCAAAASPPTASSSTVDHLSRVPATRHTASCQLPVAATVFLSGYHPYFSQKTSLYFSHFIIFSLPPASWIDWRPGYCQWVHFWNSSTKKDQNYWYCLQFSLCSEYGLGGWDAIPAFLFFDSTNFNMML